MLLRPRLSPRGHRPRRGLTAALAAAALACAALGLLATAPPAPAVTIGVADQRPDFLTTPSFQRTRIGQVRILVGWNAVDVAWQRVELDRWMAAARAARVQPLVTFGPARTSPSFIPSSTRFRRAVEHFRDRYPWVRQFSTWNEANHCGSRMCRRPGTVARYWRQLRLACRGCRVLAADLVDAPNLRSWVRAFRRAANRSPSRWGLHDYLDANRFRTTYTRTMLSAIGPRAQLWLTETGGLVDRNNRSRTRIPQGIGHAARATAFLLDRIRRVSPRIQRIYFYNWIADAPPSSWDSAFLNHRRQTRRAYAVLRDRLARLARAGRLTGRLPAR